MTRRASRLGRPIQHRRVGRAIPRHTIPAQCPVRGASLALSLTGCLPSTASATSMTPALFGSFLGTTHPSDSSWPCIAGCRSFELPGAVRDRCTRLRTAMRPPRFRRLPFVRERVTDLGRASAPRLAVPHMLPSTVHTVSASAMYMISRLNSRPHTIAVYASPVPSPTQTQHSLPGGPLRPYLGGTCTRRNAPASPGAQGPHVQRDHATSQAGDGRRKAAGHEGGTPEVPCGPTSHFANARNKAIVICVCHVARPGGPAHGLPIPSGISPAGPTQNSADRPFAAFDH